MGQGHRSDIYGETKRKKTRNCLRCEKTFVSEDFEWRMCLQCRGGDDVKEVLMGSDYVKEIDGGRAMSFSGEQ